MPAKGSPSLLTQRSHAHNHRALRLPWPMGSGVLGAQVKLGRELSEKEE